MPEFLPCESDAAIMRELCSHYSDDELRVEYQTTRSLYEAGDREYNHRAYMRLLEEIARERGFDITGGVD